MLYLTYLMTSRSLSAQHSISCNAREPSSAQRQYQPDKRSDIGDPGVHTTLDEEHGDEECVGEYFDFLGDVVIRALPLW